jgi:virginiamycin B lyase
LWFTEATAGKIGAITTDGVVTEYAIPTYYSSPLGITVGPDRQIWFVEDAAAKVAMIATGRIAAPQASSSPPGGRGTTQSGLGLPRPRAIVPI